MELFARVQEIFSIQSGLGINGAWSKQNIIVETSGDYPKKVCLSIWNRRVDVSELVIGKEYTFHVNVESREHREKWYTELTLWKIGRENTAETGRPLLKLSCPLLNGSESNLEILQKFYQDINTNLGYTKGIEIGNEISNEKLIIDQRVLDFIDDFKREMNDIAFSHILKTINNMLKDPEGFLDYPAVVQQYFINKILITYYGYKPFEEGIPAQSFNAATGDPKASAQLNADFLKYVDEAEAFAASEKDITDFEAEPDWGNIIMSGNASNSPERLKITAGGAGLTSEEIPTEDISGSDNDSPVDKDLSLKPSQGRLKLNPEKVKNLKISRKITNYENERGELNDPDSSL